jgi:hypothetical protein
MLNLQTIYSRAEIFANVRRFDWSLKLGISLELGAWNLEF